MIDSKHFTDMLNERSINHEWAIRATCDPDRIEEHDDGTMHFIKQIPEFGNRWLRVVVDISVTPEKRITAFFDRRLR